MKESTNNALIFIMISIFLIGIVIFKLVDKHFSKSPNRTVINMIVACIIINIMIMVFLVKSFSKIQIVRGPPGPKGNRGEIGNIGNPDSCGVCGKQPNSVGHNAIEDKKLNSTIPEKPLLAKETDPWSKFWGKPVKIYKIIGDKKCGLTMVLSKSSLGKTISNAVFDCSGYADTLVLNQNSNNREVYIYNRTGKHYNKETGITKILPLKCNLTISDNKFQDMGSTRDSYFDCDNKPTPVFIEGTPFGFSISATDVDHYTCYFNQNTNDDTAYFNCDSGDVRNLIVEIAKPEGDLIKTSTKSKNQTPIKNIKSNIYKRAESLKDSIVNLIISDSY